MTIGRYVSQEELEYISKKGLADERLDHTNKMFIKLSIKFASTSATQSLIEKAAATINSRDSNIEIRL